VLRYLVERLALLAVMLWLVSLLAFGVFYGLPSGDPAVRFVGQATTPATIAVARHSMGLDAPLYVQYLRFAEGLIPLPGTFLNKRVYYSFNNGVAVREEILKRAPVTAALVAGALTLVLLVSVPLGALSALRPRSLADRATMMTALTLLSIPSFTVGYLLLYVFWFKLRVAAPSGLLPGESVWTSILHGHFVLPWIALGSAMTALYTRLTRSSMLETLSSDPIRTARAKGLPEVTVVGKHALRGALVPLVTIVGLDFGVLLGGTVVIETAFDLPGIGQYATHAVLSNDLPAVMGVTVFAAVCVLLANLVVDLLYAALDPRVRYA
jgi:peptide/nickel transport system permease protein